MGLSHSDGGGRHVEKASATTNTRSDADEGKINFLGEEVSGVNRLSLHSDVNCLAAPDSRTYKKKKKKQTWGFFKHGLKELGR